MTRSEVQEHVVRIISEQTAILAKDIRDEQDLRKDLGMDSLDQIEAVLEIEKFFEISIPDDLAQNIRTIGELADQTHKLFNQP